MGSMDVGVFPDLLLFWDRSVPVTPTSHLFPCQNLGSGSSHETRPPPLAPTSRRGSGPGVGTFLGFRGRVVSSECRDTPPQRGQGRGRSGVRGRSTVPYSLGEIRSLPTEPGTPPLPSRPRPSCGGVVDPRVQGLTDTAVGPKHPLRCVSEVRSSPSSVVTLSEHQTLRRGRAG